jgi:hypothetical protein
MPLYRYSVPVQSLSAEFWVDYDFWDFVIFDIAGALIIATLTDI